MCIKVEAARLAEEWKNENEMMATTTAMMTRRKWRVISGIKMIERKKSEEVDCEEEQENEPQKVVDVQQSASLR